MELIGIHKLRWEMKAWFYSLPVNWCFKRYYKTLSSQTVFDNCSEFLTYLHKHELDNEESIPKDIHIAPLDLKCEICDFEPPFIIPDSKNHSQIHGLEGYYDHYYDVHDTTYIPRWRMTWKQATKRDDKPHN